MITTAVVATAAVAMVIVVVVISWACNTTHCKIVEILKIHQDTKVYHLENILCK